MGWNPVWRSLFESDHKKMISCKKEGVHCINTSYLTESYIAFTFKMESVTKNTIFGLKMMMKSGLEKIILKSLHAGRWLFLLLNLWFVGISKTFFRDHFSPSFLCQKFIFGCRFRFEGKNDIWICQVRHIKG